jgi:hypothetical protein
LILFIVYQITIYLPDIADRLGMLLPMMDNHHGLSAASSLPACCLNCKKALFARTVTAERGIAEARYTDAGEHMPRKSLDRTEEKF